MADELPEPSYDIKTAAQDAAQRVCTQLSAGGDEGEKEDDMFALEFGDDERSIHGRYISQGQYQVQMLAQRFAKSTLVA